VIFEIGFFISKLGLWRFCALYKGGVEISSDFSGVLWIRMDAGGVWQLKLTSGLKVAVFDVVLNRFE